MCEGCGLGEGERGAEGLVGGEGVVEGHCFEGGDNRFRLTFWKMTISRRAFEGL